MQSAPVDRARSPLPLRTRHGTQPRAGVHTFVAAALACGMLVGCATAQPQPDRNVPVTAENLPEVQRTGYTVVNRDGQKLYCRRDRRTGSHARYETSCLTAEELDALQDSTQRGLEAMRRTRPPPQERD